MRKGITTLGSALALSSSLFMQNPSYSQSHEDKGVLERVYSVIKDEKFTPRECSNVEMKTILGETETHKICAIAQEAEIEGVKFRFFASDWIGYDLYNKKPVVFLTIMVDYGDKPCVYELNYRSDERGFFNDEKVFYSSFGTFEKDSNGGITNKKHEGCWRDFMDKINNDFDGIRKMHKKTLEYISRTMDINERTQLISGKDSEKNLK